jgi:vacuolar-type H+-ATPase subunit I/STV1
MEDAISPRTFFLSRLFGLYYILAALSMVIHKQTTVETVTALLHNSPVMFLLGIITLVAGLAMVLAHNIWSGGALAVIVTLIGWITLIKGLLFLFLPPEMDAGFFLSRLHYEQFFYLYAGVSFVLGVYLTYGGFTSKSHT